MAMSAECNAEFERDLERHLEELMETTDLFPLPGPDFDPLAASDEEIKHYGLPEKPDKKLEPARYAFWYEMFSPPLKFQELRFLAGGPTLRPTRRLLRVSAANQVSLKNSLNWCGAYLEAKDRTVFGEIHGTWRVPVPNLPADAPAVGSRDYCCSTWIGFDGQRRYHHSSLPQIGTAQFLRSTAGVVQGVTYSAWWQWWVRGDFSQPPVTLPLAINAGDLIMCSVIVRPDRRAVKFLIKNATTGHFIAPFVRPAPVQPVPLRVSGATAQWVTERPSIWPTDTAYGLPNYGTVLFSNCLAVARRPRGGPRTERDLAGCSLINMYEVRRNPSRTARISAAELRNMRRVLTTYQ
jgi:hypothetical protein